MSCLAAVLPARLVALCAACGVLAWRPSARSERPCDLCGVHNCCLRVPLPCCVGLCPSGGRVPSSVLHALPHSGSRWESGTSQIPASPEGCHVALWRAAEGGAYHGHAAFALSWSIFYLLFAPLVRRPGAPRLAARQRPQITCRTRSPSGEICMSM